MYISAKRVIRDIIKHILIPYKSVIIKDVLQKSYNYDFIQQYGIKNHLFFFCSNNCMHLQKQVLPRCPCIVVESMEKPVQTAVWPETPTAPGMEKTALPLHKPPKGLRT